MKDTSKPIRFKTIQKNTKLAEFVVEENKEIEEEKQQIDDSAILTTSTI